MVQDTQDKDYDTTFCWTQIQIKKLNLPAGPQAHQRSCQGLEEGLVLQAGLQEAQHRPLGGSLPVVGQALEHELHQVPSIAADEVCKTRTNKFDMFLYRVEKAQFP